jgi:hypothetical protein
MLPIAVAARRSAPARTAPGAAGRTAGATGSNDVPAAGMLSAPPS